MPASIAAGEWHEYRVTRDATTGEVVFYVDGLPLGDALMFDPNTDLPTGGAQGTLHIGINYNRDNPAKFVGGFAGLLDELVIWNEVTTATFIPPDDLPCGLAGDLNGDCALDVADWMLLRNNQHSDMAGLTLAEAFARGDLNGDFLNNHADFVLFKTAFESTNGAGSFVAMLAVPEPAAIVFMLSSIACLALRRPFRQ
jgi:hypothetical protein